MNGIVYKTIRTNTTPAYSQRTARQVLFPLPKIDILVMQI